MYFVSFCFHKIKRIYSSFFKSLIIIGEFLICLLLVLVLPKYFLIICINGFSTPSSSCIRNVTSSFFGPNSDWSGFFCEIPAVKVNKFQNEFIKSTFLLKYEQNIVRISALYCATLNRAEILTIFRSYFGMTSLIHSEIYWPLASTTFKSLTCRFSMFIWTPPWFGW